MFGSEEEQEEEEEEAEAHLVENRGSPTVSLVYVIGTTPSAEFQQPRDGLQPYVPVMLAGMRHEPPVSEQKPADTPAEGFAKINEASYVHTLRHAKMAHQERKGKELGKEPWLMVSASLEVHKLPMAQNLVTGLVDACR